MNLRDIPFVLVRRFQDKRKSLQCGMSRNTLHRLFAKESLAELFMAVLVGSAWILAVIKMDCFQPVQADHLIKMIQNAVKIVYQVVSSIPGMAGVEANAQFFVMLNALNDLRKLLKSSSNFRALPCHGLQ